MYSADTYYDKEGIERLHSRGILSTGRRDALLSFPWDCDLVLHEAGVPPIHTPITSLEALMPAERKNIQLIHVGGNEAAAAKKKGFPIVKTGVENTIVLWEATEHNDETLETLQLLASISMFKDFTIAQVLELLHMSESCTYEAGDVITKEGNESDTFIIILHGTASICVYGNKKVFRYGDYLGEIGVMTNEKRTATITADTFVVTIELSRYAFAHLIKSNRKLYIKMKNLVSAR